MGCTRAEIQAMSLRELILRQQAYLREEKNAVRRELMVVNTIRSLVDADPVTFDELIEAGRDSREKERRDYQALKGRYPEFVNDPTI